MRILWKDHAKSLLDQAKRRGESMSLAQLAEAVGKNRTTLWRNKEIRELVTATRKLVDPLTSDSPLTTRRTAKQQLLIIKMENERLLKENERLLINFVVVCRRLQERGIDPRLVLGELTPEMGKCEWKQVILPWRDV